MIYTVAISYNVKTVHADACTVFIYDFYYDTNYIDDPVLYYI